MLIAFYILLYLTFGSTLAVIYVWASAKRGDESRDDVTGFCMALVFCWPLVATIMAIWAPFYVIDVIFGKLFDLLEYAYDYMDEHKGGTK